MFRQRRPALVVVAVGALAANVLIASLAVRGGLHGFGQPVAGQLDERLLVLQALAGVVALAAHMRDMTEQKRLMTQLRFQAAHDGLTALLNRASFLDRLRDAAKRASGGDGCFMALLFVDVDRFKVINDHFGHLVGDQVLVGIARQLQASVRPGDIVARLGGDEFAILLASVSDVHDASAVADRIQASLRQPLDLDGHRVVATASIGITVSTPGSDRPEDLLRTADAAMYHSKAMGPARYKIIDRRHGPGARPPECPFRDDQVATAS